MTLREILNILGKNKAAEIAGCGKSAAWHWYQKGKKQKVPEMQALIQWSDHLKLSDAELGELVRDAHRRRVSILEGLAQEDTHSNSECIAEGFSSGDSSGVNK